MSISESASTSMSPVVFISYSWTNSRHTDWVANLARRLRSNGIDVQLDRWNVTAGNDLNLFMEKYANLSSRVLVVLSDDYAQKANSRAEQPSGVATETAIVSSTIYSNLGSNRVVPIIPDSGTVRSKPILPTYLSGRKWIDFRDNHEGAYEDLLRTLHEEPLEPVPQLGANPFIGTTADQARAMLRNAPERWCNSQEKGKLNFNLNENSGHYTIGHGAASFNLQLEYPFSGEISPESPKLIRHYRDQVRLIGLVKSAFSRPDCFQEVSSLPLSNRIEVTEPGDAIVMLNHSGYWALLLLDDLQFQQGFNTYEPIAKVRFTIATDRTAQLSLENLPAFTRDH